MIVSLICSSLHHMRHCSSSLLAVQLLSRCSDRLSDELKLDRLLPYFVSLLADPHVSYYGCCYGAGGLQMVC